MLAVQINPNPPIPNLPKLTDKTRLDVRYSLIEPFANAHIYWDPEIGELIYDIEEPILDEGEKIAIRRLEDAMIELINVNVVTEKTNDKMMEYIDKTAKFLISELNLKIKDESYSKIFYYLYRDFVGLNEVEPLLRDYFIEDIECNGADTPIYIVHRSYRNIRTTLKFKEIEKLGSFVEKLAQRCGKYVSYSEPLLDGSLPDGSRVNATYTQDITSRGPTFCFKDGYVQLSDGKIKKIKELFEESKINFGSKMEDGNEIVEVSNINCCGVEEKNLEQKDSQIKRIIKLPPPEKIAKVNFEDGGEMEVTLNHKFHVADNSLHLIEAKDLREGMYVPMPKKVNVVGYRQKIDVYSLLRDFSYIKKICLASNNEIKQTVGREIERSTINGNYRQALAQSYGVSTYYFYEIMACGNSISFEVMDQMCQKNNMNFSDLGELAVSVYGGGVKDKSKSVKVPKEIDEDLAYLAGALISDGHLSKGDIFFCSFEESFRKTIQERLLKVFGRYYSSKDENRTHLCSLFAPFFFNKVFGIPIGNKSRIVKVPEVIFKSDNKVISSFLRGLFDGDGTASAGVSYKTYSKELAEGVTYLLSRLGIYSYLRNNQPGYRVNVPSPYYTSFMELVGFDEQKKKKRLTNLIDNQIDFKKFIRHDRIPANGFLDIIKKLGMNKTKIVESCNVNFNRLGYPAFSRSFAEKIIEEVKKDKNASLFKKELENLELILNSGQEFVKIKSVEIIDNSESVYDIELSPCTFFIAGNKPMNIFDTLRKFTKVPWTPIQLIALNTLSPEILAYFWMLIQYKSNIFIAGGTSSGKTTLLNAIAFFIPPEARVVSIEDTRELNLPRENWIPAVARVAIGTGGVGEIDLFDLLKNSFRQNPNYVIVGEVRGKEAFVLFQGMASGHPSISTMHADSVDTLIKRLETPPIELSPTLVNSLDCVAIMTHAVVKNHETRRLREIVEIINAKDDGTALVNTPFAWNAAQDIFYFKKESKVFEKISVRYGLSMQQLQQEFVRRARLLYTLYQKRVFGFDEVRKIITDYYRNPQEVMQKYGLQ